MVHIISESAALNDQLYLLFNGICIQSWWEKKPGFYFIIYERGKLAQCLSFFLPRNRNLFLKYKSSQKEVIKHYNTPLNY